MDKPVIIIGAGGHARVIAEILECQSRKILGFLDDNPDKVFEPYTKIGKVTDALLWSDRACFIFGVGNNQVRNRLEVIYRDQIDFITAIHPKAIIAADVIIDEGTVVMPGAVINPGTRVGKHCIINTASSVDHDCLLEDFVHISPGATLAGTVYVGLNSWVGAGAVIINDRRICADVVIGAGAVVIKSLTDPGTYVGVPARRLIK